MSTEKPDGQNKSVPFALPGEEEEDVFSSLAAGPRATPVGGFAAVAFSDPPAPRVEVRGPRLEFHSRGGSVVERISKSPFQIGRQDVDLKLDDPFVSPFHAQLRKVDNAWRIEDLGSARGVFLRIEDELALQDHDEIVVGEELLVFRTSWDTTAPHAPFEETTPIPGAPLPKESARLIRYLRGGHIGGVFFVTRNVTILGTEGDIELSGQHVDSTHATIEIRNGAFLLKDTNSEFGTFIRIHDPVELIDGDAFLVGRTRMEIFDD